MGDFNVDGSLSNVLRGIKPSSSTNPNHFDDWYQTACFTLSIAHHVLEGQTRPNITTSGATISSKSLSSNPTNNPMA